MRDQSPIERTIRATNHARAALLAGYTTYRDLGTEALGSADASFRDCVNRGLTPGPRMFVATEAIASSGGYEIRTENRFAKGSGLGLSLPRAADIADGVDGVRAAVRRRVGEGADVIKFYGDYRRRVMRFPPDLPGPGGRVLFPPDRRDRNPAVRLFSQEEMDAIVREARVADVPVAAHAGETMTALMAARAGVTSVEHVFEDSEGVMDELIEELVKNGTILVPTLTTAEFYYAGHEIFKRCKAAIKTAFDKGVRVAAGGDTGVFNHGLNCREMEIMMEAGIPVEDVLVAGTYTGWHACGGDACGYRFGWWDEGNRADIIALDADPRKDHKALRRVNFVMKDGRVWKRDGLPVGMVEATQWPDEHQRSTGCEELPSKESNPKPSGAGSPEASAGSTSSTPPFASTPPSWVVRLSGNPTPAGSDIGWETESLDA
jgi:imidazolonepropionase-like amidohydrolase